MGTPILPTTHRQGWGQSDCVARDPGIQRLEEAAPSPVPMYLSAEAWCRKGPSLDLAAGTSPVDSPLFPSEVT